MVGGTFSKLGAKLSDLEAAWPDRLEDANILKDAGRFPTSITLGLYALEILLKVKVCKRLDLEALPTPFQTHDLDGLLTLSGLKRRLDDPSSRHMKSNWFSILSYSQRLNDLRYRSNDARLQIEIEVNGFFVHLNDDPDGVITWILREP